VTRALCACLLLAAIAGGAVEPERVAFGRFGAVILYRDTDTPAHVAVLVSGAGGWDASMDAIARALAASDTLVIGVDGARYASARAGSADACDYPAGELEALSQFVQKKLARPSYGVPYLIGVASGATLARAALAQAPPNTFRAGLGADLAPEPAPARPYCRAHTPVSDSVLPWAALAGGANPPERVTQRFDALVALREPAPRALADDVSDLPLIELAPTGATSDALAVILSGDGGWASLDREVGGVLAALGMPVLGFDSLQYFWTRRTPDESAAALARVLRYADATWPGRKFALIGYSRGADVLPFLVSRLPDDLRARVALVALLGPALSVEFEFHVSDWLSNAPRADALPTAPEVAKLRGLRVLCVYGRDERDSLCPTLAPELALRDERPGDHHFGGDYAAIGARIAQELAR
jgi:type IV secretory pathway VirJ component